mgnify:CR=1 FL=1
MPNCHALSSTCKGTERASAVRWYSKACKLGDGNGCLSAGHFNTYGLYGASIDQLAGVKLYESACRQKVSDGCLYAAYMTILMHEGKGAKEEKQLVDACKAKSTLACAFAGRVIGARAKSLPEMERARGMLSKACHEKNAHGCAFLGEFLLKHKDLSVGNTPAQTFLERGCKGRIAEGCMGLASFFMEQAGTNKYTQIVVKHLTDACLYGELGACDTLGRLYYEGKFIPVSYSSALFFARRGCAGRFGK